MEEPKKVKKVKIVEDLGYELELKDRPESDDKNENPEDKEEEGE